jgi:hypothetical protein
MFRCPPYLGRLFAGVAPLHPTAMTAMVPKGIDKDEHGLMSSAYK